jgi:malate dehydrogenase (oxaloacetate-decarboxylating)(NADP+)
LHCAGLAFSEGERDRLYLRGLLPPAVLSQEVQAERALVNIRSKSSDLERHSYLTSLQVPALCAAVGT